MTDYKTRGVNDLAEQQRELYGQTGDLGKLSEIEITKIQPGPWQPRTFFDPDKIKQMAGQIRTHGQLEPGSVVYDRAEEVFYLISGERRWRAAQLAGLERYKAVVLPKDRSDYEEAELLQIAFVFNEKDDLKPVEQARHLARVKEASGHKNDTELAKAIGRPRTSVREILSILKLPDEMLDESLEQDHVSQNHLVQLAKLSDETKRTAAWKKVTAGEMSVGDLRVYLKRAETKPNDGPVRRSLLDRISADAKSLRARLSKAVNDTDAMAQAGDLEDIEADVAEINSLLKQLSEKSSA